MRLLLDTHVFIWWYNQPARLSSKAQAALRDPANTLILSVASIWEMQIKLQLGRLAFTTPLRVIIQDYQAINDLLLLPVTLEHALALDKLPAHHKDPFDRLIVAQAMVESAALLSSDPEIARYPIPTIW